MWLLSLACVEPVVREASYFPFPREELITDGHVALEPLPAGETAVPVERVSWRNGFSPVQTTVFELESLPTSLDDVHAWDMATGEEWPVLVELDAWPDNDELPVLLVRPTRPYPVGTTILVAIGEGTGLSRPGWLQAIEDGLPVEGVDVDATQQLMSLIRAFDVEPMQAVRFPVGDGTAPMRHLVEELSTPSTWAFDRVLEPTHAHTIAEGSFTTDTWLTDTGAFELDSHGLPLAQGQADEDLYVFIPDGLEDAEPGSVPVWVFGHGIFSEPSAYLGDEEDPNGLVALATEAGAIVIATTWRGMTRDDLTTPIAVGNDFGRIPELTDKLQQGVANTLALSRMLAQTDFLEDEVFMGLPDPSTLRYYGISLGGIEGAVLLANSDVLEFGVLHVGGSSWSTMLERSSNWSTFETLMEDAIPSPSERQLLYAASQLFWDPIDPALYAGELSGRPILWQESIGDEQVPNLTTRLLLEGVGVSLLEPAVDPWMTPSTGPLSGPAVAQFDPEVALPPETNRPSPVTGAHGAPRHWAGQRAQTARFLDPDDPGVVEHFCGDAPCSASNPGD
jgi:hypothetical protein